MLRIALSRSSCSILSRAALRTTSSVRTPIQSSLIFTPRTTLSSFGAIKWYSASTALSEQEVRGRIIDLLMNFDKVKASEQDKISPTAHFYNDLGLDSLDTVEVVMAIEEEFSLEIPDKDADAIQSVDQAVKYILAQPDAH